MNTCQECTITDNMPRLCAFHESALTGDLKATQRECKDSNINCRIPIHGYTALYLAALMSRYDTVKYLLERKADVNRCDFYGTSPTDRAIVNNDRCIAEILRMAGGVCGYSRLQRQRSGSMGIGVARGDQSAQDQ